MSDWSKRIADLSSDKRALLELRLKSKARGEHRPQPEEKRSPSPGLETRLPRPSQGRGEGGRIRRQDRPVRQEKEDRSARDGIDFSLFYFSSDESRKDAHKHRLLLEGAQFADRHGFLAVWTPERHFHPFGGLYPNPSLTGAALAVLTKQIRIRAGSVVLPLHDPIRVAEEWSLVDNLSDGRVDIAFASGWHANDFAFFPRHYPNRREVMYEGIELVQKLWRGESAQVSSGNGQQISVKVFPKPIQPELPLWITAGGSQRTFLKAGEIGANLLTNLLGQSIPEVGQRIRLYRDSRAEHGHDPEQGRVSLMMHAFLGESLEAVRKTVQQPFCEYLKSFTGLLNSLAKTLNLPVDQSALSPDDMDSLLEFAFERYFDSSGLFGTPDSCLKIVDQLKGIGVDEIACLIDFGVDEDLVLDSLHHLDRLRQLANPSRRESAQMQKEQMR